MSDGLREWKDRIDALGWSPATSWILCDAYADLGPVDLVLGLEGCVAALARHHGVDPGLVTEEAVFGVAASVLSHRGSSLDGRGSDTLWCANERPR